MKKISICWNIIIFTLFFTCLPCLGKQKIHTKNRSIRLKEKTGIIKQIFLHKLEIYDLKENRQLTFGITKPCIVINKKSLFLENTPRVPLTTLKRGYKVKIFINPFNNLIKKIYIEEIPQ